jgi:hypothetical protein
MGKRIRSMIVMSNVVLLRNSEVENKKGLISKIVAGTRIL